MDDELMRRLQVGRRPVLALLQPVEDLEGWYVFVELVSDHEVEVRFQASANEEGGVAFLGRYTDAVSMIKALAARFGPVETWSVCAPQWPSTFPQGTVELMRRRIREKTLPLPEGVVDACDDPFWST